MMIPVQVDYNLPFGPSDQNSWEAEYNANIKTTSWSGSIVKENEVVTVRELDEYALPGEILEQIEEMEPTERQYVLDELAARPDLWAGESERCVF
ncbi:hypothetical protein ACFL02_07180 [Planctomycetota bacterium]